MFHPLKLLQKASLSSSPKSAVQEMGGGKEPSFEMGTGKNKLA